MAAKLSAEERERIVALLREGKSQTATAREAGRSPGLVNKIAREEGIVNIHAPKKANEARRDYAKDERVSLLNEGFEKARALLSAEAFGTSALKDWSVAVGTLIDKRRLEDGEATERKENVDPSRRERIKGSLDEVARRRRERMG